MTGPGSSQLAQAHLAMKLQHRSSNRSVGTEFKRTDSVSKKLGERCVHLRRTLCIGQSSASSNLHELTPFLLAECSVRNRTAVGVRLRSM